MTPDLVLLGNLLVDDVVFADGSTRMGQAGGAMLYAALAASLWGVRVFADIKKKHAAHAITADVSIAETARAAEFFLADAVIVTGSATGEPATRGDVSGAVNATRLPVLVGSGVTPTNLDHYAHAHGFIVGSSLKQGGVWSNPLDPDALRAMVSAFAALPKP